MIKVQRLRRVLNRINDIWKGFDNLHDWKSVVWLLRKQLDEIEEGGYAEEVALKEMADMLIIVVRRLDNLGIDPERLMIERLETRHRGKTGEIIAKYAEIAQEEEEKRLS